MGKAQKTNREDEVTMSYKDAIRESMETLSKDEGNVFVGYGLKFGGGAMGTLANVAKEQIIETPVAEGLMVSLAIGLSLAGKLPVVYIERADFLYNATDAIVNHLDKIRHMSRGEFEPAVIIRVTVGNKEKPLFTGETHTQDPSSAYRLLTTRSVFDVEWCVSHREIAKHYAVARANQRRGISSLIFEYKDWM